MWVNGKYLDIVDEGVKSETQILLQYFGFHDLNVDDAWNLLLWVAWDSFEFEKACCVYRYYFSRSMCILC